MLNLFTHYQALITSPEQLALCQQANSVAELLATLKKIWQQEQLSDDQLIAQLHECNQQCLTIDAELLVSMWLPYRYDAKTRNIFWCLPAGRAIEPFHDQFITRSRQRIFINQLLTPRTLLSPSVQPAHDMECKPAGFVFHLSRCGSTLVSGSIAEVEQASVLSESLLLTEFLLDSTLTDSEKARWLPGLIQWQCGNTPSSRILIKWNAWDIFHWPLIRTLYPQTPVVLLVRDPVEILASHQHSAGRHMSGDPSMINAHPVFGRVEGSIVDFRIRVLDVLLQSMLDVSTGVGVQVVDYSQLTPATIQHLCKCFDIILNEGEFERIQQRMQYHSKEPDRQFTPDSQQKQQVFTVNEQERIRTTLMPLYEQLLSIAKNRVL